MPRRTASPSDQRNTQQEAYRVLRSNLAVALGDLDRPTVVVTSSQQGEGKTATTIGLAQAMAAAGRRVVLADLDMRHPDCHRWIGAHNEFGLSDVLLDRRPLEEALQYVPLERAGDRQPWGLFFLATGPAVRNPAELLGTRRTAQVLEGLAREADLVLIDTPPILPVADTLTIARMAAGAILVVEPRRTPLDAVRRAKDALTRNQCRILGLVINKYQARDTSDGTYGYGYGYGSTGEDEAPAS